MGFDFNLLDLTVKKQLTEEQLKKLECKLCHNILESPKRCNLCNQYFCAQCGDDKIKVLKDCPLKCDFQTDEVQSNAIDADQDVLDLLLKVKLKCSAKCKNYFSIKDLSDHQDICQLAKCQNFNKCKGYEKYIKDGTKCCSFSCYKNIKQNEKIERKEEFNIELNYQKASKNFQKINEYSLSFTTKDQYQFNNIISDIGLIGGLHVINVSLNENHNVYIKIGIATTQNLIKDPKAFSDFEEGFAWFSVGQLRHASDFSGKLYGPDQQSIYNDQGYQIKIILDMQLGTLQYRFQGESFDADCFESEKFKKGPVYFAMAVANPVKKIMVSFQVKIFAFKLSFSVVKIHVKNFWQ